MEDKRPTFLLTCLVNVTRNGKPDQIRFRSTVRATSKDEARKLFEPMAREMGVSFTLEPIDGIDLEKLSGFPGKLREYCARREYELANPAAADDDGS